MATSLGKFYGKIWVSVCLNTEKRFFLEVSFSSQQKEHGFFEKTVLGIHWKLWNAKYFLHAEDELKK